MMSGSNTQQTLSEVFNKSNATRNRKKGKPLIIMANLIFYNINEYLNHNLFSILVVFSSPQSLKMKGSRTQTHSPQCFSEVLTPSPYMRKQSKGNLSTNYF